MLSTIRRPKRSYHTDLILQSKFDLLSTDFKKQIPSSTLNNWKKKDINSLFGYDNIVFSDEKITLIKAIAEKRSLLRITKALYIAFSAYDSILSKIKFRKRLMVKSKDFLFPDIEKIAGLVGMKRTLRFFRISYQQFYSWKHKEKCNSSPIKLCFKKHPMQISLSEMNSLKTYFKNYQNWDLKAIYYKMIKDGCAFMSLSTWYKYASLLELRSANPSHRRKKHMEGLRAKAPKEIIHMDVTIFRPLDNSRVFIYLIIDNFSRCILGWKASKELRCSIALENLKGVCLKHNLSASKVDLIVDGGSENNCANFNSYIELNQDSIRKLIAQKDILFSNSMVESSIKNLKYQYLFKKDLANFEETVKYLEFAIPDHSNKPHGALLGLTPIEALNGAIPDKYRFKMDIANARSVRIKANKNSSCGIC